LTCFAPGKNEEMRNWFLTLMDSQFDKSNQYSKLREAMKKGCVNVWHYPLEMATDYLIVEKNGKPDSAIIGFCTGEDVKRHLVYNAGIYLANKEACEDLVELYGLLVLKAKEHLLEQENKSPNERCICYNFLDRKTKTLLPS
jgi:hypothetical protein